MKITFLNVVRVSIIIVFLSYNLFTIGYIVLNPTVIDNDDITPSNANNQTQETYDTLIEKISVKTNLPTWASTTIVYGSVGIMGLSLLLLYLPWIAWIFDNISKDKEA